MERMHAKLQKLDKDFYDKVENSIKNLHSRYLELMEKGELTRAGVLLGELENIKAVITDIYEIRERKIVLGALNYARRGDSSQMENLLEQEKIMFNKITEQLGKNRKEILENLLSDKPIKKVQDSGLQRKIEFPLITVRILEDLPPLVGIDGKIYGSFRKEDIASLPEPNARALISRGAAEEIRVSLR
jgi:DNA replication initiation complex subunit (GINS family)